MKITQITYKKAEIQLSLEDIEIFKHILKEVQLALEGGGFETRVSVSPRLARGFFESILQEIKESGESQIIIGLCRSEMTILNNLLNEASNGINIANFKEKIGVERQEVKNILSLVNKVINEMDSLGEIRRHSIFSQIQIKKISIEGDGYTLTFYLSPSQSQTENKVRISFMLTIKSTLLKFSTVAQEIWAKELWDLVNTLEKYIDFLETEEVENFEENTLIFNNPILRIQAQGQSIAQNQEKYIILKLMLAVANSQVVFMKSFLGVKGAVSFNNIRSFTLSMGKALTELSEMER